MTYHHTNVFERDGEIIVDLIGFDDDWAIEGLYLDAIRSPDEPFSSDSLRYSTLKSRASTKNMTASPGSGTVILT